MDDPFNQSRFASLLTAKSIGRNLVYRTIVESTMPLAAELAAEGAPHGTAVLAEEQTAGRGRRGRGFHSPRGENLYFTLILRLPQERMPTLSLAVPLAVCRAVCALGVDARIKWPNDIWAGDRKLSGMLIDVDDVLSFPGIGINVNGDPTLNPELRDIATSIARELGVPADREALLAAVCNGLEETLDNPVPEMEAAYAEHSMILGRRVRVAPAGSGTPFEGLATDIDSGGELVVQKLDGSTVRVTAADVSVRPAD